MPMIHSSNKLTDDQKYLKQLVLSRWEEVASDLGTEDVASDASIDWLRDELGARAWKAWSDEDKGIVFKHITGEKW